MVPWFFPPEMVTKAPKALYSPALQARGTAGSGNLDSSWRYPQNVNWEFVCLDAVWMWVFQYVWWMWSFIFHIQVRVTDYPLVNQHSYWKWPFIVSFPIKHGDFPYFFVTVYQRVSLKTCEHESPTTSIKVAGIISWHHMTLRSDGREFMGVSLPWDPWVERKKQFHNLDHQKLKVSQCSGKLWFFWLVVSTPLKKIVSWDDYSQYMEK